MATTGVRRLPRLLRRRVLGLLGLSRGCVGHLTRALLLFLGLLRCVAPVLIELLPRGPHGAGGVAVVGGGCVPDAAGEGVADGAQQGARALLHAAEDAGPPSWAAELLHIPPGRGELVGRLLRRGLRALLAVTLLGEGVAWPS